MAQSSILLLKMNRNKGLIVSFLKEANKAIRNAGGRMTPQRRLVIDVLAATHELLDAETLYLLAHERDETVSLATIYRTLHTLEEAGLVQQRYLSPEHDRRVYELIKDQEEYHFTCRQCRTVIPFYSEHMKHIKDELGAKFGLEVLNACLCMDGLCPDCRAKLINGEKHG